MPNPPAKIDEVPEVEYTEESNTNSPDNDKVKESEITAAQTEAQRMLVGIVSDPEVAQILAARREGRTVKIVDVEDDSDKPDPVSTEIELPKETLEDLDPNIKTVVETISKHIDNRLTPLTAQLAKLQTLADGMQAKVVEDQIGTISTKHKDFEKYRPEMARLSRSEGSGLSVEQLYTLAKLADGKLDLTEPSLHSEKPTPTPKRKGIGPVTREGQKPSSRASWNATLADALDRTLSPSEF